MGEGNRKGPLFLGCNARVIRWMGPRLENRHPLGSALWTKWGTWDDTGEGMIAGKEAAASTKALGTAPLLSGAAVSDGCNLQFTRLLVLLWLGNQKSNHFKKRKNPLWFDWLKILFLNKSQTASRMLLWGSSSLKNCERRYYNTTFGNKIWLLPTQTSDAISGLICGNSKSPLTNVYIFDQEIPFLGVYPRKNFRDVYKHQCTQMFVTVVLITKKIKKIL